MRTTEELLSVRQAHKAFRTPEGGQVVALDDLSLTVRGNEFLTLLGPSGCGKTTLLRVIGGFEDLDRGELLLEGHPLAGAPPYRRPFNTVFQSYALFPHLSVRENVAYGLEVARVPTAERRSRVGEALGLVGLGGLERRMPRQLSGGQQQRVALARAIVNRPRLLLLDEPLSALDRQLRQSMQLELKSLQANLGITFVFVTHDQEEALTMSDRIAVLDAGRIQQLGSPLEIYDRPANRFVATFIGTSNIFRGRVAERAGSAVRVVTESGVELHAETASVAAGEPADVVLRPEHFLPALAGSANAGLPSLEASIYQVVFVGSDLQLHCRLRNGESITALHRHARRQKEDFAPGMVVRLHYHPSAPHVMAG